MSSDRGATFDHGATFDRAARVMRRRRLLEEILRQELGLDGRERGADWA